MTVMPSTERTFGVDTDEPYDLSPEQAAEFLKPAIDVTPRSIRRWAIAGNIDSFVTPGGHRRFRRSDLEAFLRAHT